MLKHFAFISAALTAAVAFASGAGAMETGRVDCPERDVILADLEKAGEQRVAVGVKAEGIVMEIFLARNGNWTEIWTWPRGQSCVIAFGNNMAVTPPSEGT